MEYNSLTKTGLEHNSITGLSFDVIFYTTRTLSSCPIIPLTWFMVAEKRLNCMWILGVRSAILSTVLAS